MTFLPGEPFVHDRAVVDASVKLGDGTHVWSGAVVEANVATGVNCAIGSCAFVGMHTVLGESCRIQHGAFIPRRSRFGDRVFVGPNATFTDDPHPKVNNPAYKAAPPIVEDDVCVGAGATILPGVRLGRGCVVGAGAVVTKDVAPYTTVVGVPARALRAG